MSTREGAVTCPDCGEACAPGSIHACRYRGAVRVPASPPSPAAAPASPIQFREFDAEQVARELEAAAPSMKAAIESYERAKHVSQRTLQMCMGEPLEKDWQAECERLVSQARTLREALRDIRDNYDHEEQTREHQPFKYGGSCRVCTAAAALSPKDGDPNE